MVGSSFSTKPQLTFSKSSQLINQMTINEMNFLCHYLCISPVSRLRVDQFRQYVIDRIPDMRLDNQKLKNDEALHEILITHVYIPHIVTKMSTLKIKEKSLLPNDKPLGSKDKPVPKSQRVSQLKIGKPTSEALLNEDLPKQKKATTALSPEKQVSTVQTVLTKPINKEDLSALRVYDTKKNGLIIYVALGLCDSAVIELREETANYAYLNIDKICKGAIRDWAASTSIKRTECLIVAKTKDQIQGFMSIDKFTDRFYIDMFCSFRGSGRIMFQYLEQLAHEFKIPFITLSSIYTAIPFYRFLGFHNMSFENAKLGHSEPEKITELGNEIMSQRFYQLDLTNGDNVDKIEQNKPFRDFLRLVYRTENPNVSRPTLHNIFNMNYFMVKRLTSATRLGST